MRYIFQFTVFFIFMILYASGWSQSFTWQADTTFKYGSPGTYFEFHTDLINNTSNPLQLRAIRTVNVTPTGWQSYICTNVGCYPPEIDTVDISVAPGGTELLQIDISSSMTPSVGTVTMKVENVANPSENLVNSFSASTDPTGIKSTKGVITGGFRILQNYPNPFNPTTTIPFEIGYGSAAKTILSIYNIIGQRVRILLDENLTAGYYEIQWDGKNSNGFKVPSGVYFYELRSGSTKLTGKMILMK